MLRSMENNIKSVKVQAMRLSEDFSNLDEFAYFVGGRLSPEKMHTINEYSITMADGETIIHGGYYAVASDEGIAKWYPWDFEALFEPSETIEHIPAGWSPYPADIDERKTFGMRFPVGVAYEEFVKALKLVTHPPLFAKKKDEQTLRENPIFVLVQEMTETEDLSVENLLEMLDGETTLPSGAKAAFVLTPYGEQVFATNYECSRNDLSAFINRKYYELVLGRKTEG